MAWFRPWAASGMVAVDNQARWIFRMLLPRLSVLALLLSVVSAWAQAPAPSPAGRPAVEEESPGFQALRPAGAEAAAGEPAAATGPAPHPALGPPQMQPPAAAPEKILPDRSATPTVLEQPVPPPAIKVVTPPPPPAKAPPPERFAPSPEPAAIAALLERSLPPSGLVAAVPGWLAALLMLVAALLAALFGVVAARSLRQTEVLERRRALAATLAIELETRRLAFEAVPLPPNIEAGVSFVSSVTAMAGIDCGFRTAQAGLFLLPAQVAANISVHYAAVQRVADFVKGQSMAAAVRMLQANRLGGHPCPDAGAMREAHVELAAAFRGLDKLILSLRALQR